MDFLDPQKQKAHSRRLAIGYALIGLALVLATTVLLYRAYGFGLDKNGQVIQNGLVFVASGPDGADIFINGKKFRDQTDTRVGLPGGQYTMELRRDGYRTWKRAITVEGGSVGRFDYPVLIPTTLLTTITKQYAATPLLADQSPDQRWLLVQNLTPDQFDLYDLNADQPTPKSLAVPTEALTPAATTTGWAALEWADNNRNVVLQRTYQKDGQSKIEYILFDRENPAQSRNLTVLFGFSPTTLELRDGKADQYYLFDQNSAQLFTATLDQPTPQVLISDVLAFATDEESVLYATTTDAPAGKVLIKLRDGEATYNIRQSITGTTYLLELERYRNALFVAAGSQAENRVHIYKNPNVTLRDDPTAVVAPVQILKTEAPTYVSFSPNARFVMAESADRFAVYDAGTDKSYAYQTKVPLDPPQQHARWMDGFHLQVVSGSQLSIFDYDGTNLQTLVPAHSGFRPFFNRNYQTVYTLTGQNALTATSLLTPEDQ